MLYGLAWGRADCSMAYVSSTTRVLGRINPQFLVLCRQSKVGFMIVAESELTTICMPTDITAMTTTIAVSKDRRGLASHEINADADTQI